MPTPLPAGRAPAGHEQYPRRFLALPDPPRHCFWSGPAWPPPERAVAVVGARAASGYGRQLAGAIAGDLSRRGIAVVSGLARGIDAAAHAGALEGPVAGVAVVAVDPERAPLDETRDLHRALVERGAVCSEYGPGVLPRRGLFLRRNRLVAALALGVVVVEAGAESGALVTAAWARRLGRWVAAVPGDVTREGSRGVLELLRAGAMPVACGADVAQLLGRGEGAHERAAATHGDPGDQVLRLLRREGALPADRIAMSLSLSACGVATALLQLELAGRVRRSAGGRFAAADRGPA